MFYFHLFNRFFMTVCLFIGRFYCVLVNINVEISSIVSHCDNIYFCRIEDSFDCAEQQNLVCRFSFVYFSTFLLTNFRTSLWKFKYNEIPLMNPNYSKNTASFASSSPKHTKIHFSSIIKFRSQCSMKP